MMGRNVATYKFALAASLIELSSKGSDFIPLEDLATPFSKNLCEHLKYSDKQITSPRSQFLDSCRKANQGEVSNQELIETTARLGFVNVIDAFHVVNKDDTPVRFFNDDRKTRGGITLTDDFFYLAEGGQFTNLPQEVEARWNLVETAWGLDMARNLLDVEYDPEGGLLYVPRRDTSRTVVTSCRDALNGYQKGDKEPRRCVEPSFGLPDLQYEEVRAGPSGRILEQAEHKEQLPHFQPSSIEGDTDTSDRQHRC
jgi:hypothetical protein